MKASMKLIELDGDAVEIASVLSAFNGAVIEAAPAEANVVEAAPAADTESDRAIPFRETATRKATSPLAVVETDNPTGEPVPGPFEHAEDIPAEWRLLNGTGLTVHTRAQPGRELTMCKRTVDQIDGRRRMLSGDTDIHFANTKACEACAAQIESHHERTRTA